MSRETTRSEWIQSALDQYEVPLTRYALRIVRDEERARDVVQETFLRLCREDQTELDGRLAAWLYTVCRSRALDVQRKERRMETLASPEEQVGTTPETDGPDQAIEQQDSVNRILQLMNKLPDNQQEVLRLKFHAGLSYREIASVTGLSTSNVGFLIHRGLTAIRTKMNAAPVT